MVVAVPLLQAVSFRTLPSVAAVSILQSFVAGNRCSRLGPVSDASSCARRLNYRKKRKTRELKWMLLSSVEPI